MAPSTTSALVPYDDLDQNAGVPESHRRVLAPKTPDKHAVRNMGPGDGFRNTPSNLTDDPALVVALVLTAVFFLLGFSAIVCSGQFRRCRRNKPAPTVTTDRSREPVGYLKPARGSMSPSPCTSRSTLVAFQPASPISEGFKSHSIEDEETSPSKKEPISPNITPSLELSTWGDGGFPARVYIRDNAAASTTRLFSVPEVDESAESDSLASTSDSRNSDDSSGRPDKRTIIIETSDEDLCASGRPRDWAVDSVHSSSDGTHSIGGHAATETEGCFDSSSSGSDTSVTTVENCHYISGSGEEGDDSEAGDITDLDIAEAREAVFEVRRGQTQSLELAKGVLVVLPGEGGLAEDREEPAAAALVPRTITDSAAPTQTNGKKLQIFKSRTVPNLQFQRIGPVNESDDMTNGPSTTYRPPTIPALIVTQPSTLSLFTIGSSASDISMDLGNFPLPPLHLEPQIFWQKLEEEINQSLASKRRSM